MLDKYSNWLVKLKKKYQAEIDNLQEEEYRYLVTNYRFEGSTLIFIFNIQFKLYDLTLLIVNHNSPFREGCKYLCSIPNPNNRIGSILGKIKLKIDENEELHSINQELLKFFENQLKKKIKPRGKGNFLGGGTIGRDSWFQFMFEGKLEDISIDNFFTKPIKEAKNRHQMKTKFDADIKNRNISLEIIEPLNISNDKVKYFIDEVKKDLEKIINNIAKNLKELFSNRSSIIENNALEKYGFLPEDSKACKIFEEMLPIENLTIQADLDSRRFTIQIRGLYGYLIEEILQKYVVNPDEIENYIIKKINEFIKSYKTQKIPYEIILPLNGIIADLEESNKELRVPFSKNAGLLLFDDVIIITKSSDLILGRSTHYNKNNTYRGINTALSIYCKSFVNFKFIERNSFFFHFDKTEPESINNSKAWLEIRNIFSSFILSNFKIGYSKQFYKFPWWIPKKRYRYDFPTPDWLRNVMYFNPSEKMSVDRMKMLQVKDLVPESYRNITFPHEIDKKDRIHFTIGNISNGIGFFKIDQGKSHEMGFQESNLKIPSRDFQILRNAFNIYSNQKNPINFYFSQFIIKQIINLRLREKIEDAILDSCLIIESLLIRGETELSYQFRLHTSLLLSKDIHELKTNISFFKDLYNLRSKIVHGYESWHEIYRKFLKNHTRWNFAKSEWDSDQIEFTRSEILDFIFMKILQIIIRINEIGLSLEDIQKPSNLIAKLKFNPLNSNLGEINQLEKEDLPTSREKKRQKLLKKLKRIEKKLSTIIDSENLMQQKFCINLKQAIMDLSDGEFEKFQKRFCSLNMKDWSLKSKNQIVLDSILNTLKKLKAANCINK